MNVWAKTLLPLKPFLDVGAELCAQTKPASVQSRRIASLHVIDLFTLMS
jgi:hypothetical protein